MTRSIPFFLFSLFSSPFFDHHGDVFFHFKAESLGTLLVETTLVVQLWVPVNVKSESFFDNSFHTLVRSTGVTLYRVGECGRYGNRLCNLCHV
jgi:hypothetical protein